MIGDESLYSSPPQSFTLPSYAERIAQDFVAAPSPVLSDISRRRRFSSRVLAFIDDEADQCDQHFNGRSPSAS